MGDVVAGMPRNGDDARLIIMFELAVTSSCSDVLPTILFNHSDNLSYFHTVILPPFSPAATIKLGAAVSIPSLRRRS